MKKVAFLCWFMFLAVSVSFSQVSEIQRVVDSVRQKYASDERVSVYRVKIARGNPLALKGEIYNQDAYNALIATLKKTSVPFMDSIRLLPDKNKFGENYWTFVPLSVINISTNPSFNAEISKQALMGTPIKILDKYDGWYQIQTPDGYIGWTNTHLKGISLQKRKAYNAREKVIVTAHNATVYEGDSDQTAVVSDVIMGNLLTLEENYNANGVFKVSMPDGRQGYLSGKVSIPLNQWKNALQLTGDNLVALGKEFIGLPYFWGGTSVRGVDCSGFINTLYFMHGIILPRDASQQYYCGKVVDTSQGWDKLEKGDLLFFGEKNEKKPCKPNVIHVALYIGNSKFIHSSNTVHISSFDPASNDYDDYNRKRFLGAKRIIAQPFVNHWSLFEHPWYR